MRGILGFFALVAVLVGCWLVGTATAQQGGITPTTADLRHGIKVERQLAWWFSNRKCLDPGWPAYRWPDVRRIPADKLRPVLYTWQVRKRWAVRQPNRCGVSPARAQMLRVWFRTSGAACVKSKEGAWESNTGNGYYGGFQADLNFQRAYGLRHFRRWGTANYWPPVAQIDMAHRGYLARGWWPWPTTARLCGLL